MTTTKVPVELSSTPGIVDNSDATAITIDSSENVGIGMTPASTVVLDIKEADASTDLILGLTAGTGGRAQIRSVAQSDGTSSELSFLTRSGSSTSEAMRIDASGNLLIGVTSTTIPGVGNTTAGVSIRGDDGSFFSRALGSSDTNNVVSINRTTADGNILGFQKDGSTVGLIQTKSSQLSIGTGDTGIQTNQDVNAIIPHNITTNANVDNSIDLGYAAGGSNFRFKDIYLSGGAYLGGTGSANFLDDYEEGSFTPALNGFTGTYVHQIGQYRKVGGLVTASVHIHISSTGGSGAIIVTGLPFTQTSTNRYGGATALHCNVWATSTKPDNVLVNPGTTTAPFYKIQGQTGVVTPQLSDMGTGNILCVFVYMTA